MGHSGLNASSARRAEETSAYLYRRRQFLLTHPYCQVWCAEHGIDEQDAIRCGGRIQMADKTAIAPLSTEIHHRNKRRGADLLLQVRCAVYNGMFGAGLGRVFNPISPPCPQLAKAA